MSDLNGLVPPAPDIDLSQVQIPGAVQDPGPAPAIILEGSGAAAHFVWTLEPERLPDERRLPKSGEQEIG